ncbi:MAG TPA: replicative DNA helicase [Puia sp.]|nr:replicative DNA helicase [Puia sp.]
MQITNLSDRKQRLRQTVDLNTMVYGKLPPQAKELEEAVLGAIMLEQSAFDNVAEILKPEHFYVESHQLIFRAMQALTQKSQPIDILTVTEELRFSGSLEKIGGAYFVTRLTNAVVSAANIEAHSRIVLQKFIQRELIRISGEIIGDAYEDSTDVFDLLDDAESKLFEITNNHLRKNFDSIDTVLVKTVQRIEDLRNKNEDVTGVPTGFASLDHVTYGWQPTDLIILAARPSVGKTAFALNLARHAALHKQKATPVGFFSLEMSAGQLVQRILSAESEIWLEKIARGRLQEHEMKQLYAKGIQKLATAPIFIDDTAALNIFELRAKCRRLKNKHNVGLIIIDYLQLMSGTGENRNTNREQEISRISRDLKGLAKELQVPIIALSQLSREVEKRKEGSKMPQLSDLRECVTGDTRVWLADGRREPIQNLVGQSMDLWSLDHNYKLTVSTSELIWPVGVKRVFELTLASGRKLKASGEHRVLGFEGWTSFNKIKPGDQIASALPVSESLNPKGENLLELEPFEYSANDQAILKNQRTFYSAVSYAGETPENDELKKITRCDIFWDKVISMVKCGEEQVFDLTVNHTHNWIANEGIVTHNSGAIEQDADMVMFLYRPEYYDITTNELGENNRGETHVRIAKHRNGSLETIKLKALLHIQKFIEEDGGINTGLPQGNWKPVQDDEGGEGGAKLYIQAGSKMNDLPAGGDDEEYPF